MGALGLRTGVTYTSQDIRTSRSVVFPGFADSLGAGYNAGMTQVFGDLGYKVEIGRTRSSPLPISPMSICAPMASSSRAERRR